MLRRVPANILSSRRKPFRGARHFIEHDARSVFGAQDRLSDQPDVFLPGRALQVLHLAEPLGMGEPVAQVVVVDVRRDVTSVGHFLFSRYRGLAIQASPSRGPPLMYTICADSSPRWRSSARCGASRRRSAFRDRRHHRGRGRIAGMPGAAVRPHQGLRAGLARLHQRHHHAAARRARARHRSGAAAARRAQGVDGEAPDAEAA